MRRLKPYDVYADQLTSLCHGHALWEPDPANVYEQVEIGDVGYVGKGFFHRIFNVLREWDDPLHRPLCRLDPYPPLDPGPFVNIRQSRFPRGHYYSRDVTPSQEWINPSAEPPNDIPGTTYRCRSGQGALLVVPHDGLRKDVIRTGVFEDYIREHVDSWFSLARQSRLGVRRMEDLILVTGCTLVTSWGVAAFVDRTLAGEISLRTERLDGGGASFDWHMIRPGVVFQNSHQNSAQPRQNQCIFIGGLRAKRVFRRIRLRGEAEPPPDDLDNTPEGETEYRDPLIGVLDYIVKKCPNTVAIARDDDLRLVKEYTLNPDVVEGHLRQHDIGVLVKNGAATLHGNEELRVSEVSKAIFDAEGISMGKPIPFILHPVLSNYLLKLDITNQLLGGHHLCKEDITSPATHPAVSLLRLENHQGYPRHITIWPSSGSQSTRVTVQDVLRTIYEDMRMPSHTRDWAVLSDQEQAAVDVTFRERCKARTELGQGLCRIDYLCGKDRLQILPKPPSHGERRP